MCMLEIFIFCILNFGAIVSCVPKLTTLEMTDLNGTKGVSDIVVLDVRGRTLTIWLAQYGRNRLVILGVA